MPPELPFLIAAISVLYDRIRARGNNDEGLTTLEVAIIAGGLALLATGVVAAITTAVNNHKANIK